MRRTLKAAPHSLRITLIQRLGSSESLSLSMDKIIFQSSPNQFQIDAEVLMNELVSHASNVFPWHA
jgi:hypothetical protein